MDRRVAWTGLALASAAVALLAVRAEVPFPVGYALAANWIANEAFAVQVAAVTAGVVVLHVVPGPWVHAVLIAEGAVCLLAHGAAGLGYAGGLLAWWAVMNAGWLGRARAVAGAALLAALNALAWTSAAAQLFSMIFTMRLIVYAYDRWQHDFERVPLRAFLVYALPAPLVIAPPFFTIIPFFDGFAGRVRPALTSQRLRAIGRHLALAAVFGASRYAMTLVAVDDPPAVATWRFAASILDVATFGHIAIPLLLLHGIEERMPLDRPLLSTSIVEYWRRFAIHLRDAQVFLFYTPALLLLRRANRYLAIVLATLWTLVVGNTLLHLALRLPDMWPRLGGALLANAAMGAALAAELCYREWRHRRGGAPAQTAPRVVLGWLATMAIAIATSAL